MTERNAGEDPYHLSRKRRDVQHITARPFAEVVEDLGIDIAEIKSGESILSIGDGLSEFPDELAKRSGSVVTSADPVYSYVSPYDSLDEAKRKLWVAKERDPSLGHLEITSHWGWSTPKQSESRVTRVADSVYRLSFDNKTFDQVLLDEVIQYIDLKMALPEMIRVLKSGGEIRFGRPVMWVKKIQGESWLVIPGAQDDKQRAQNWIEAFVAARENGANLYACHPSIDGRKGEGEVQTFIIKFGDELPRVQERGAKSKESVESGTGLFRVEPERNMYHPKARVYILGMEAVNK